MWTPFLGLEKELRSVFERIPRAVGEAAPFELRPSVDMVREDGALVLTVELPGIDPEEDVEITVEGDALVIEGEKAVEKEVTEQDRYLRERRHGRFERRLPLPDGVDLDAIVATYDSGVLTIRVPLSAETVEEVQRIPVRTG